MTDQGKILAVDDTSASLRLLTDILKNEGYEVRSAINGELALRAAASNPPDLVLLDIRMPGMDGYEVCRRLKAEPTTREVPVIFVSAVSETDEKVRGFAMGAVDFVTKPYQRDELMARVRTHLELHRLRHHLEDMVEERSVELRQSQDQLRSTLLESITALAATVEMRDPYTAGHQRRVAQLAVAIAKELLLPPEQIEGIELAGVVHDAGKIQVPAEILSKPGKLTKLELGLIQEHASNGYEILHTINFPWPIAQIVWQHHERLDGSGYPRALKGEQTLLEAKVLAVADVVEAMSSHWPYRAALGIDVALQEIERGRDTVYDAAVVDACVRLFAEKRFAFST
ncbi:MAG: response regulator [Rhodoferax sp.]|nr:response regulator [Rhodoferax sp.]